MNEKLVEEYIKGNWKSNSLIFMSEKMNITLYDLLVIAYKVGLQNIDTNSTRRSWTSDEEKFLQDFSEELNVRQASNLLKRSHYATYQRVKLLGLNEMISKK